MYRFFVGVVSVCCSLQLFQGNTNDYGIVQQQMNKEIEARYIRFLPVTWFNHVCMKVELYGYQGMIDN